MPVCCLRTNIAGKCHFVTQFLWFLVATSLLRFGFLCALLLRKSSIFALIRTCIFLLNYIIYSRLVTPDNEQCPVAELCGYILPVSWILRSLLCYTILVCTSTFKSYFMGTCTVKLGGPNRRSLACWRLPFWDSKNGFLAYILIPRDEI